MTVQQSALLRKTIFFPHFYSCSTPAAVCHAFQRRKCAVEKPFFSTVRYGVVGWRLLRGRGFRTKKFDGGCGESFLPQNSATVALFDVKKKKRPHARRLPQRDREIWGRRKNAGKCATQSKFSWTFLRLHSVLVGMEKRRPALIQRREWKR